MTISDAIDVKIEKKCNENDIYLNTKSISKARDLVIDKLIDLIISQVSIAELREIWAGEIPE